MNPGERGRFYPGIEVLRGVAALLVLVYHVIEHGRWESFPTEGALLAFRIGWIGVDLFLVISGFVIALSVLSGLRKTADRGHFRREFAERRWRRIAPLYFLTMLVFLFLVQPGLLLQDAATLAAHVGSHSLFLHNLLPGTHGSINGPNWSVALEMQFYLLMAFLGPWLVKHRPWQVLLGLFAAAVVFRACVFLWLGGADAKPWVLHVYTTQLFGALDEFAVGIMLAMMVAGGQAAAWFRAGWRAFIAWSMAAALLMALAMMLFWPRADYWPHWPMVVGWRSVLAIGLGAVVASALVIPDSLARLLRPLGYLGEISYGLYLWHLPVLLTLIGAGLAGGPVLLGLTLLGTGLLAAGSWHFFEKPFLDRRKVVVASPMPAGSPARQVDAALATER